MEDTHAKHETDSGVLIGRLDKGCIVVAVVEERRKPCCSTFLRTTSLVKVFASLFIPHYILSFVIQAIQPHKHQLFLFIQVRQCCRMLLPDFYPRSQDTEG